MFILHCPNTLIDILQPEAAHKNSAAVRRSIQVITITLMSEMIKWVGVFIQMNGEHIRAI